LKLKARLAVLSACESGLGKSYSGEGMVSMASAFTYAGCQDILMSLWKVQDQIAVQLMNDFYKNLFLVKQLMRHWLNQSLTILNRLMTSPPIRRPGHRLSATEISRQFLKGKEARLCSILLGQRSPCFS